MRTLGNTFALGRLSFGTAHASILNAGPQGPVLPEGDGVSLPSAPAILSLTPVEGGFSYVLEAPSDDGGAPVTEYRIYTGAEGDEALAGAAPGPTGAVAGLAAVEVRITARALNSAGAGDYSASALVTPLEMSIPLSILRDGTDFAVTGSLNADLELDVDADTVADYTIPAGTLQATIDAPQFVALPTLGLSGRTLSIDPGVLIAAAAEGEPTIAWHLFRPDGAIVASGSDTMDVTYETIFLDEGLSLILRVTATYGPDRPLTVVQATQPVPASTAPVTESFDAYAAGTLLGDTADWVRDTVWSTVDSDKGARVDAEGALVYAPGQGRKERLYYQPVVAADRRVGILYGSATGQETKRDAALIVDRDPASDSHLILSLDGSSGLRLSQRTNGSKTTDISIQGGPAPVGRYEVTRVGNLVEVHLDGVSISGPHTVDPFPAPGMPGLQFLLFDGRPTMTFDDFVAENI